MEYEVILLHSDGKEESFLAEYAKIAEQPIIKKGKKFFVFAYKVTGHSSVLYKEENVFDLNE